jgi:hypothetical protein
MAPKEKEKKPSFLSLELYSSKCFLDSSLFKKIAKNPLNLNLPFT